MSYQKTRHLYRGLKQQSGLSLVELLIAMTLGLFLIWGVTQSFLTSRQVYAMQQALSRIQENTRMAQEFMAFDIRNAGDYGCSSGDSFLNGDASIRNDVACTSGPPAVGTTGINMVQSTTSIDDNYQYAVYGFDNVTTAQNSSGSFTINGVSGVLNPHPKVGTDVLMVHVAQEIGLLNAAIGTPGNPSVLAAVPANIITLKTATTTTLPLLATDRIAVSDCANTKIFGISAAVAAGSPSITLGGNYCTASVFQAGASLRKVSTIYYYVAANNRGGFSLFRQIGNKSVTNADGNELLEGVEDLQLQFGIDNQFVGTVHDGTIDVYKSANDTAGVAPNTAALWDSAWNGWDYTPNVVGPPAVAAHPEYSMVRAVRYSLLMVSVDNNVLADQQQLDFNGTTLYGGNTVAGAGDRRLRQVVTSTVGIRSRVQ